MGYLVGLLAGLGVLTAAWSRRSNDTCSSLNDSIAQTRPTILNRLYPATLRHPTAHRDVWPEVVDDVASGIKAGLSLPQAVFAIAVQGPREVRATFHEAASIYVDCGDFVVAISHIQATLKDPVGDRFIVAIRIAYELGGSDLGLLLRSLSESIREDIKMRGELEARQSWTVNGARLAVAAPWVTALVLSFRADALAAYTSATGMKLLGVCLVLTTAAYFVMLRIGRLPTHTRVLT